MWNWAATPGVPFTKTLGAIKSQSLPDHIKRSLQPSVPLMQDVGAVKQDTVWQYHPSFMAVGDGLGNAKG